MTQMFVQPEREGLELTPHVGHLVTIAPVAHETGIKTKFGNDKEAIRGTFICVQCETELPDTLIFQGKLIGVLKGRLGQVVLGTVGQEPTDKGNPAWVLNGFTEQDAARAQAYYDRRAQSKFAQPAQQQQSVTQNAYQPPQDVQQNAYVQQPSPAHEQTVQSLQQQLGGQVVGS